MTIHLRIKDLRKQNNMTQLEFSSKIGVDNSQYSKIERGILEPTLSLLLEISSKFNVSLDWIATGVEPANKSLNDVKVVVSTDKTKDQFPAVVTVDSHQRDNIVLVPIKAAAGYLTGYGDPEFIKTLPTYRMPNLNNGTFRMFQVKGHSMNNTLHHGAIVVGEWVENWPRDIKDDRIYVIMTQSDGVIVKRVLNRLKKYNNLICKSDNRKEYPSFSITPDDIIEIWEVKLGLLFELPNPADLYDRVVDLEAEMMQIKHLLAK
ncbi:XRE family transcriptional regulator [Flavobacterium cerinum]|uniref:Helix-turn-helix domain-containing protein n=1 Tax=Flavobacterium cerinum TaxID=2502784 RepID=A0A3S3QEM8_9FLAO|nr:helix-turn-helix domain-containing protein [Flavobacterium cerinum]RWX03398.1 helix-turn-helix domain-containing protein [Flavobacterium cerinum]